MKHKAHKIFASQLQGIYNIQKELYFIEIDDKYKKVGSVSIWKMGALFNTHKYIPADQKGHILPVFRKIL